MSWTRLRALIIKELLAVLRDPKSRFILFGPPLMQLLIFSTAATLDVKNVDLLILNHDNGFYSQEIIERISAAKPTFRTVSQTQNQTLAHEAIDRQKVVGVVTFQSDFSAKIMRGEPATVYVMLDGRKSNTAQIVAGYLNEITQGVSANIKIEPGARHAALTLVTRNWFNPNLIFQWFMVPNLVASIAFLIGVIVTALAIAREREVGTFDQLIVSPLKAWEILVGKAIPPMIIGFIQLCFFVLCALFIFSVPLRGSLFLLFGSAFFFLLAVVGIGLFISGLAQTQQQAILGAFLFLAPAMLLSGFATPVENMPHWLQTITAINPLRYFLLIVRGVFLKDISFYETFMQTWPMMIIAIITLSAAALLFRKQQE